MSAICIQAALAPSYDKPREQLPLSPSPKSLAKLPSRASGEKVSDGFKRVASSDRDDNPDNFLTLSYYIRLA